jgi:hypothetical protein
MMERSSEKDSDLRSRFNCGGGQDGVKSRDERPQTVPLTAASPPEIFSALISRKTGKKSVDKADAVIPGPPGFWFETEKWEPRPICTGRRGPPASIELGFSRVVGEWIGKDGRGHQGIHGACSLSPFYQVHEFAWSSLATARPAGLLCCHASMLLTPSR